ncbi:MAG TPA: hypothetical protein VNQ90_14225 [Chthoniobacteraceae bacterium]|nr:hypothetical protein [Chthoniobacteraceae bacterium]
MIFTESATVLGMSPTPVTLVQLPEVFQLALWAEKFDSNSLAPCKEEMPGKSRVQARLPESSFGSLERHRFEVLVFEVLVFEVLVFTTDGTAVGEIGWIMVFIGLMGKGGLDV